MNGARGTKLRGRRTIHKVNEASNDKLVTVLHVSMAASRTHMSLRQDEGLHYSTRSPCLSLKIER